MLSSLFSLQAINCLYVIDRVLDMIRTMISVTGRMLVANQTSPSLEAALSNPGMSADDMSVYH